MTEISILNDYQKKLAEEFQPQEIKFKPEVTKKTVNGQKVNIKNNQGEQIAGCTAHIDARDVMNRLDAVVGVGGWSDSYQVLNNGKNVECTLTVLGVSKSDVGQTNEGGFADPLKAAYSDSLKRAAVKFGIARHLYSMEMQWKLFDGYKIIEKPTRKATLPPVAKKVEQALKENGQGEEKPKPDAGKIADLRASLESNGDVEVNQVAKALVYTGLYRDNKHVYNTLNGVDFAEQRKAGLKTEPSAKWVSGLAIKIFDKCIDRKADDADKEAT